MCKVDLGRVLGESAELIEVPTGKAILPADRACKSEFVRKAPNEFGMGDSGRTIFLERCVVDRAAHQLSFAPQGFGGFNVDIGEQRGAKILDNLCLFFCAWV